MYDFLIGISVSRGGVSLFDPKIAGLVRFATQIDIIKSICDNMDNVLFDIKSNIEFEILDNELTVLSNLESHNAELIKEGKSKEERFEILSKIAKYQLDILNNAEKIKLFGEKNI